MRAAAESLKPRELPILFSGPMVRAILEGRKTQTRRLVKPQPAPNAPHDGGTTWHYRPNEGLHVPYGTVGHLSLAEKMGLSCPYGEPGDRLWVRETWKREEHGGSRRAETLYRADMDSEGARRWRPWKPSIHMPRWASRLMLEVVSVRVARLSPISEADALAEGVTCEHVARGHAHCGVVTPSQHWGFHFENLWRSINGAESWASKPWVWAVEFRRFEVRHG